ncbi:MAG: NADH-quinone oxidoreductase subunit F [Thermomicrobiales bacterium]|nr:NADH-quinone oxidoreductase subunit F [Thermomicrobiales bacterium]
MSATYTSPESRLSNRAEFDARVALAKSRWDGMWNGDKTVYTVGLGSCSIGKGADKVLAALEQQVSVESGIVRKSACNGACWMEPWVEIKRPGEPPVVYQQIQPNEVADLLGGKLDDRIVGVRAEEDFGPIPSLNSLPFFKYQQRIVLANCGVIDPDSLDDALATGAYEALAKVLFDLTDEEAIAEVTAANLRGRGGAGFPAGIKWESGRKARNSPKFVVCNSHEGEPNVYKDRRIHEGDPHRILEGILIACFVVGAERGYNYIGGEYPLAIQRFRRAVADAAALGLIGKNVLGTGKNAAFRVRTGGGAYVCGEGSALMYSVMGVRGQPRTKPPRSVEEGLWKRPTVANNTETLSNIRDIILKGGEWYASIGTEKSKGTKLMTVQGPLKTMGLVEVPMGITMRTLIEEIWGGMRDGYTFKGVQTGGVSAGPLKEEHLDLPVDFDSLTDIGGMLGSGGFVVFDESVCAVDFARYMTAFNRVESCSKCVPCHRGNPALVEVIDRIRFGRGSLADLALIERTSKHIIDLSLCGLGQVAPMPLLGLLAQYRAEFEAHITDHVCSTGDCPVGGPSLNKFPDDVSVSGMPNNRSVSTAAD